jgi:hypothetical protein
VAALVSLLLAFGRHGPLYQLVYSLPYFSTIRNPVKFLYPLHVSLLVLFGYGMQCLWQKYVADPAIQVESTASRLKQWWREIRGFDRKWTVGSVLAVVAAAFGWLLYSAASAQVVQHLMIVGFPDPELANRMARHSVREVGWFVFYLALSVWLMTLALSRAFSGRRIKWAGISFCLLLTVDLIRADTPWIVFENYRERNASNPIIDRLKENAHEHRVTAELTPRSRSYFVNQDGGFFPQLYYDWLQNALPFHRVQSLDIIQMPRVPEFDEAFMSTFRPTTNDADLSACRRLWELTNTRYAIGMSGFLDSLNQQLDPDKQRLRIHTPFNIVIKPGATLPIRNEDVSITLDPNGQFALFEFTGALPRAKLFTQWQINTSDTETLQRLRDRAFDPARQVLVASEIPPHGETNAVAEISDGVEFSLYSPKHIRLTAHADAPSVLLLNDRYHRDWRVWVDGKPETLLRCNYIMRGVFVTPGKHEIEFRFQPSAIPLYVSLTCIAFGIGTCAFLMIGGRRGPEFETAPALERAARPTPSGNRQSQ